MSLRFRPVALLLTFFSLTNAFAEIKTTADLSAYLTGTNLSETAFSLSATLAWQLRKEYMALSVCDETGFAIFSYLDQSPSVEDLRSGDRLDVHGVVLLGTDNRLFINCTNIHVVSHGSPPTIPVFSEQDFRHGKLDNRPCRITGIVRDVRQDEIDSRWDYVALDCGTLVVTLIAWADKGNRASLTSLIGSTVSGIGLCNALPAGFRRQRGRVIHIARLSDLTILNPAPSNPFDVPDLTVARGLLPRDFESLGPSRLRGSVLATWHGDTILIQTPDGGFARIESIESGLPAFGTTIEAVGYPETDLSQIILSRARWRYANGKVAKNLPTAKPTTELSSGSGLNVWLNGQTVSIRGTIASMPQAAENGRFFLKANGQLIAVDASGTPDALSAANIGSKVAITGTYVVESEIWRRNSALPRITGFFIALRSPSDLIVLARPPWWTPARLGGAIGILLSIIIAILFWNASLHTLVARKTRALLKEQSEKLSETLKIDERTRLAAELHDYHSQNLTAISYQISAARTVCGTDPGETSNRLATAAHMLKSCRTDLRRCLWDLRNDTLNEPDFAKAILRTVTPVAGSARPFVRFTGRRSQITDSTAHAILSILRELTANAANHGHATTIRIAGECRPHVVRFSVTDDGDGFDPKHRLGQNDGHFGLDSIGERLSRLGGTIEIESSPGKGSYIRLTLTNAPHATQTSRIPHNPS